MMLSPIYLANNLLELAFRERRALTLAHVELMVIELERMYAASYGKSLTGGAIVTADGEPVCWSIRNKMTGPDQIQRRYLLTADGKSSIIDTAQVPGLEGCLAHVWSDCATLPTWRLRQHVRMTTSV